MATGKMVYSVARPDHNPTVYLCNELGQDSCNHRRRLSAEFGGTEKKFADQNVLRKVSFSTPKIFDDLFLVIDRIFSVFPVFTV